MRYDLKSENDLKSDFHAFHCIQILIIIISVNLNSGHDIDKSFFSWSLGESVQGQLIDRRLRVRSVHETVFHLGSQCEKNSYVIVYTV